MLTRSFCVQYSVTGFATQSPHANQVAAMFGLIGDDHRQRTIVPPLEIPLSPGSIVFITGPSGGGKSTILRLIREQCVNNDIQIIDFDALRTWPDVPLVDVFGDLSLEAATRTLARAGLGDAFVMLRRASELSDGQRCRLRIAQAMARAEQFKTSAVILADEFCSTLDRITAQIVAMNVRRWIIQTSHTFVCATAHDDLLEILTPEVLVYKGLGDEATVVTAGELESKAC